MTNCRSNRGGFSGAANVSHGAVLFGPTAVLVDEIRETVFQLNAPKASILSNNSVGVCSIACSNGDFPPAPFEIIKGFDFVLPKVPTNDEEAEGSWP